MLKEDNSGFVMFPNHNKFISKLDTGKTFIYVSAFDPRDFTNSPYILSNIQLVMPGTFVSDDIIQRPLVKNQLSIDDLIKDQMENDEYDSLYFPNLSGKDNYNRIMSIPMTSCVCVGWSEFTYEFRDRIGFWNATFRDLTNEGRKLYYSLKKLHNNKEVRILTFNNI